MNNNTTNNVTTTGLKLHPRPDYWYARGALACVIIIQLVLHNELQPGLADLPNWVLPAAEFGLLVVLAFASIKDRRNHHQASRRLEAITGTSKLVRILSIFLIGVITVLNLVTLILLIRALLAASKTNGSQLLDDAAILWISNMVCFALCYWELDRGGPSVRETPTEQTPDFLFANMTLPDRLIVPWTPRFIDYLFVSFTNASAFSPTDALPLSGRAKILMMVQAGVSLTTVAIVAARAVNILG
jgi:uncharacterized membrane protein YhaH (DUF805 family)